MKNPAVDVIIPTYNGLPFLEEAIESVLAQTYKDFTLYIVDDGSTDNGETEEYVRGLRDSRVRYLHKKNGGQASARNLGIKKSGSPYVAFLDADDIWHPNKLQKQIALIENDHLVGMVYGLCKLIDSKGNPVGEVTYRKRGNLFKYLLHHNKISGSASMVVVRREVFDKVGLFREDLVGTEDWEMWLRVARHYHIDYVPDFIASLHVLDNSTQKNHLMMAKALDRVFYTLSDEFHLGYFSKSRLAKFCLVGGSLEYFHGGDQIGARRLLLRGIFYNPFALASTNPNVWFAYARILLGNEYLRRLRRQTSSRYRDREMDGPK